MKKILFVLLCGLCLLSIAGCGNKTTYTLNLPQLENLKNISLIQNANEKSISSTERMKEILDVINGVKRVTKNGSIQDAPINVSNVIKIDFNFIDEGSSTLFVYKKNNKYFIEQPYNGIYQISKDEYNSIEKYIK